MSKQVFSNVDYINKIEKALKEGTRLSSSKLRELCYKANEEGKYYTVIIKIENEFYREWFNQSREKNDGFYKETLEEETTYFTNTQQKAWMPNMGGYSIFGTSLATLKREERMGHPLCDDIERIENCPIEFGIIMEECPL